MAWRSGGSISRSLISAARAPSLRSPAALPRIRPPAAAGPRLQPRRSFAPSRNLGALGCAQSLLPLCMYSMATTAHLNANVRAFCELSHGRNGKDR